jgi:hypothetical protein
MNTHSYTQTNSKYQDRSGELITHPPDEEDLSGFLTSQPRQNRVTAKVSKTQPQNINDEDLSGCLTSGFLTRNKTTSIVNQDPLPAKREVAFESTIDEDPGSGWLYLN